MIVSETARVNRSVCLDRCLLRCSMSRAYSALRMYKYSYIIDELVCGLKAKIVCYLVKLDTAVGL